MKPVNRRFLAAMTMVLSLTGNLQRPFPATLAHVAGLGGVDAGAQEFVELCVGRPVLGAGQAGGGERCSSRRAAR